MKFLEHSHFEALNSALNFDAGIYRIIGRYLKFIFFLIEFVLFDLILSLPNEERLLSTLQRNSFYWNRFGEGTEFIVYKLLLNVSIL